VEFETAKSVQDLENLIFVVSKLFGDGKKQTNRIEPQSVEEAEALILRMTGRG